MSNRGCSGMTILELLLTVVIAGMVISMAISGVGMTRKQYEKAKLSYDAQVMAEEVAGIMTDSLRYAENLILEEDSFFFFDSNKEDYIEFDVEKWNSEENEQGDRLRICRLAVDRPVFSRDEGGCVVISFGICNKDGEILARIHNRKVRILNS